MTGFPETAKHARFLCDEMLQGLGRWLRAAGYDTLIAVPQTPDRELIERARDDHRLLLTCDTKMTEFSGAKDIVLVLRANTLKACISELTLRLEINWLYQPFSRCLLCNNVLVKTTAEQRAQLPDNIKNDGDAGLFCVHCGKLFWSGSHVRRMLHKLEAFAENYKAH